MWIVPPKRQQNEKESPGCALHSIWKPSSPKFRKSVAKIILGSRRRGGVYKREEELGKNGETGIAVQIPGDTAAPSVSR